MGPRRTAILAMLLAGRAFALSAAPDPAAAPPKRILTPPPLQWDHAMLTSRPALQQTAADFANLTGGLAFGMSPSEVNARLPEPYPGLSWSRLPIANEYPGEVRYFGVPIDRAGPLRMDLPACPDGASYIVFLFSTKGLFRLSYRLTAAPAAAGACADANDAAQAVLARYVRIGQTVALSLRYRTEATEVVDVSDPTAGYLIPTRFGRGTN